MRIAMWSGPRNLSTAMMYSFGARSDCSVIDEPLYAAYLARTGLNHPLREAILAAQPVDSETVIAHLTGPIPDRKAVFYQKHMTHHLLCRDPTDWLKEVVNVFLIRHPARVLASYAAKREHPTLADIGFAQQAALVRMLVAQGLRPIVIDSADIRAAPERSLRRLCAAIGIGFESAMLNWPKGGHAADGVWAAHWYGAVHESTGFSGPERPVPAVPDALKGVLDAALPLYEELRRSCL